MKSTRWCAVVLRWESCKCSSDCAVISNISSSPLLPPLPLLLLSLLPSLLLSSSASSSPSPSSSSSSPSSLSPECVISELLLSSARLTGKHGGMESSELAPYSSSSSSSSSPFSQLSSDSSFNTNSVRAMISSLERG